MLERMPLLAWIDARRAAVWITGVAAMIAAIAMPMNVAPDGPEPAVAAVSIGGLLAIAAIGFVPRTGSTALDAAWIVERVVWPAVGWTLGAVLRGDPSLAGWGSLGVVLGGVPLVGLARVGLVPSDAAGIALAAVAMAGGAGWWASVARHSSVTGGPVAAILLVAFSLCVIVIGRSERTGGAARHAANHLLTGAAMAGSLLGMVVWLFLTPTSAGIDLVASLAWFVALALPPATLGDGLSHGIVWRRLEQAAPLVERPLLRLVPGRRRDAGRAPIVAAAILGWPPLVAAVVGGADGGRGQWAVIIIAALVVGAGLLLAASALGEAVGASPDTQQAAALAGVCLATVVMLRIAAGVPPVFPVLPVGGG